MAAHRVLTGGCLCGSVRYQVPDALQNLNNCHCLDCRRASGAPFVTWGTVDANNLHVDGDVRWVRYAGRLRGFAACCGTPLFFRETADSPTIDLTVASLNAPEPHRPSLNIWTEDRLPWVPLEPGIPAYPRDSRGLR